MLRTTFFWAASSSYQLSATACFDPFCPQLPIGAPHIAAYALARRLTDFNLTCTELAFRCGAALITIDYRFTFFHPLDQQRSGAGNTIPGGSGARRARTAAAEASVKTS
jgi:hypothetical protein